MRGVRSRHEGPTGSKGMHTKVAQEHTALNVTGVIWNRHRVTTVETVKCLTCSVPPYRWRCIKSFLSRWYRNPTLGSVSRRTDHLSTPTSRVVESGRFGGDTLRLDPLGVRELRLVTLDAIPDSGRFGVTTPVDL